jgi:hypothetical protein
MPRRFILVVPLLAAAGCASENAASGARAADAGVVVMLAATPRNAGETAQATLIPAGGETRIVLNFSGVPSWTTLPVHVYTYIVDGRCDAVPAQAAFDLNERVLPDAANGGSVRGTRGPFLLVHLAPVPIGQIMDGRFALVMRSAPADGHDVIFCGELRGA